MAVSDAPPARSVVWHFAGLKLRILGNGFRGRPARVARGRRRARPCGRGRAVRAGAVRWPSLARQRRHAALTPRFVIRRRGWVTRAAPVHGPYGVPPAPAAPGCGTGGRAVPDLAVADLAMRPPVVWVALRAHARARHLPVTCRTAYLVLRTTA